MKRDKLQKYGKTNAKTECTFIQTDSEFYHPFIHSRHAGHAQGLPHQKTKQLIVYNIPCLTPTRDNAKYCSVTLIKYTFII